LTNCFDLYFRVQHSAFQLDFPESVLSDHQAALADNRFRREALAIEIFPGISPLASATGVLEEKICGKGGGVPGPAAEQIANRLADGLADYVQTGSFNGSKGAPAGVMRILAGNEPCLRAVPICLISAPAHPEGVEGEGIHAEHVLADGMESRQGALAAMGFGDAGDAICGVKADDGAEGIGGV
jgi:hypothetical protein